MIRYGHARLIGMGTLNVRLGSFFDTEAKAKASAEADSRQTSLAVLTFLFEEGRVIRDGVVVTGGFEEGRELTQEQARERLLSGYA